MGAVPLRGWSNGLNRRKAFEEATFDGSAHSSNEEQNRSMNDDITKDMTDGRSFEERVFARFDAMDTRLDSLDNRLTTLEEKVDRRLMETRPIWEAVQAQLRQLDKKFDVVIKDLYEMRVDIKSLDDRATKLETR
jgi:hypothetical protein